MQNTTREQIEKLNADLATAQGAAATFAGKAAAAKRESERKAATMKDQIERLNAELATAQKAANESELNVAHAINECQRINALALHDNCVPQPIADSSSFRSQPRHDAPASKEMLMLLTKALLMSSSFT
eukprot:scaffold1537_cov101-Isochrysis_galbana.AAC.2